MSTTEYSYTVLFEPAEEGGYLVSVPAFGGVLTQGETLEEAREMAIEAITGYIEALQKDGLPIPSDVELQLNPVKEKVRVAVA